MFSSQSPAAAEQPHGGDDNVNGCKRKRRPAGTPDPDAEVVSLSPRTLLESDRYVCEICNQGFQRDQNLQMHRRRHKVPWKLLKRESGAEAARKRVFVCPEPSCLHHDPRHALGDLVGIKKHFRRKHSATKQWSCSKCSKAYAVHSDYKAHLKTCGTRGHSCDCGRVFSRVESFIEHQDTCNAGPAHPQKRSAAAAAAAAALSISLTASSPSPSSDYNNHHFAPSTSLLMRINHPTPFSPAMELQLLPTTATRALALPHSLTSPNSDEAHATRLQLSLGSHGADKMEAARVLGAAEEARLQAKRQIELAEEEFAKAERVRQQAQAELSRALAMREQAARKVNSALLEITCQSCKQMFMVKPTPVVPGNDHSSSVVTEGDGEEETQPHRRNISTTNQ